MPYVQSARPRPELAPFVRAYAQRTVGADDCPWTQSVPAQLEQILNFELGVLPGISHRDRDVTKEILVGGGQTEYSGTLHLRPGVVSFAIFFWPAGWSQLFNVPVRELTNQFDDALPFHGAPIRELWNRMGEQNSFEGRVAIAEEVLVRKLTTAVPHTKITRAASFVFRQHGAVRIPKLGRQDSLSLRHFERLFRESVGMSPKVFARIARFQAAIDSKLANPARTWLDIAHSFGYYDQMHMIHDFERLGHNTPTQLLIQMGDVRPSALVSAGE
jgi:AraC-like DNA-binding protein